MCCLPFWFWVGYGIPPAAGAAAIGYTDEAGWGSRKKLGLLFVYLGAVDSVINDKFVV
jgi:hypothetical protein